MNIRKRNLLSYLVIVIAFIAISCNRKSDIPIEIPLAKEQDSITARNLALESRGNIAPKIAEGLTLSLWASDSLAPDPIALSIDDEGSLYVTRTNRQKNSEFDIRGYREWMTPSISLQTVEDRRAFLRETFAPEKSEENEWFPDLNNDSIHDWKDLTVEKDEVWKIQDRDGDGIADISTRILEDFNEEITDVAGALLVRDDDMFVGIGPDMWRLWDTNGDGVMDTKKSLAHGFAVHIGFGAHGMSGVIEGPDGKIYWGIGDIGASITALDGSKHHYPNQGMIVRCNPDGSNFEVYARGLRNTHEFVFDAYGNLISSDNDGDHRGESERLVHIVEGSDAGWRANWQYGKYTDPKNNSYKVWMDEKLYLPRWEGQAAYIIPPIQNYHNGPTGMVYNPGTALGKDWLNQFFLVEFIGDPNRSHIWSFGLKPKGASFELDNETDVLSGVLPTGIRFGPDGALYLADWVNGWGTKNYGRVWKLDVEEDKKDLEEERKETERLMTLNYKDQDTDALVGYLKYPDMRIRQKAQFELATRTFWGYRALKNVIEEETHQLARIHAIWGIGQIADNKPGKADPLLDLLSDQDPEIIAQAAKVLGDVRNEDSGPLLLPLLKHENPRVQFFAAQALGRIKHKEALQPLLDLIVANNDEDVYLRHAAVLALSRIGEDAPMLALVNNEDRSLRIAAVLVLRRLQHPGVAEFLNDEEEYIVAEAARAINDDWSIEAALPQLASLLTQTRFSSEPVLRRSINAALRVGGDTELTNLIDFAKRKDISGNLRGEALATIGSWASPSVLDRVDGRLRGEIKRDSLLVKQKIEGDIPEFLRDQDENMIIGVTKVLSNLGIDGFNSALNKIFDTHKSAAVRSAVLETLGSLNYDQIAAVMQKGMRDKDQGVRAAALGLIPQLDINKTELLGIVRPIFNTGSTREQQRMLGVLGDMPISKSESVLSDLIKRAGRDQLEQGIILDLIEAVEATTSDPLIAQLGALKKGGHTVEAYEETLYGGNRRQGYFVFQNNPTAQCVRCHALGGTGGTVGPPLDNIANVLSREQLLESLIEPGTRLAPGYGSVQLTLTDGQEVSGLLVAEGDHEIILRTSDAEPLEIALNRIAKRENMPSAMPAMGRLITKRELRDLIEFLANLKE
ncbi:HEAT repeat domain-containing protein [Muriicola sp. Z0-33]|uniref:HEAT repeat domain-containing protein n=1 Tax=Muriicola sp. Z0-33 TaxID=2816957 RepID=UPI002237D2B5|nr:HEAT repeat domain-containing protein [Muriicola sp. Z0-33]MCW5517525.1 HEAT repeat domain-containing protein [Muriicola sp. Z0-33]